MSKEKIFKEFTFSCKQCGASLVFSPAKSAQICEYCGYENTLDTLADDIKERDFQTALLSVRNKSSQKPLKNIKAKCPSCAGEFELKSYERSTRCPYCLTPIVTNIDIFYDFHPQGLLFFKVTKKEAQNSFKKWIDSLWFAPNDLKNKILSDDLEGIYLPYWTFDAYTTSKYRGQRGDYYYVTVQKEVFVDGKSQIITTTERRVRWSFASGVVERFFDDILIGASKTLPRVIIDSLSPWDLENLVDYEEEFLSGYESEVYQVALDDGFKIAKQKMQIIIRDDVRSDIGGDLQRIDYLKTYYSDITFKYILLPVYVSKYSYKDKEYYFAINARTNKVYGKRPYSYYKIAFLVILVLSFITLLLYLDENQTIIKEFFRYLLK